MQPKTVCIAISYRIKFKSKKKFGIKIIFIAIINK